jgi:pimeloyl-ACP methyl ester carboxylesterase
LFLTEADGPNASASANHFTRQVYAWVWYPAVSDPSGVKAPYYPRAWLAAHDAKSGWLITHLVNRDLANVQTHSISDAPVSTAASSYPIVLLRAGASADMLDYTALAEDVASYGYVVVGIDVPYRSFVFVAPDGQVIERTRRNDPDAHSGAQLVELGIRLIGVWSADLSFTLDQLQRQIAAGGLLKGRLNFRKVGVVGHSLGGSTALQFCRDDERCVAGIDVDGLPLGTVVRTSLNKPFMFLLSDHEGETRGDSETDVAADLNAIYARLPAYGRYYATIDGANHYNFSDGAAIKSPPAMKLLTGLGVVHLDGRRQLAITSRIIERFFDVYLKGNGTSLSLAMPEYPELKDARPPG